MLKTVLAKLDAMQAKSLENLFALLRFKSISTDPAFKDDCHACAQWLHDHLGEMGFDTALYETTGQPVVIARWGDDEADLPHVLFYGHYDVQPVDPLALWHKPPFEPAVKDGKIYGRGTSDDKGQVMTFVEALRAWLSIHKTLPFRLTLLLEGDEEGDADVLHAFLKDQGQALNADIAIICDTEMWDEKTPAITTSLRGCIADDVTITAARIDLHSGYYGGPARNPIKALSDLISKLHDKKGRIAIPRFYDGIKSISKTKAAAWKKLGLSEKHFLGEVGLKKSAGEQGLSIAEQLWAQPTVEVNGMWGGYTGPGSKTVLPAKAEAKFTFRLVDGQNPKKVRTAFRTFMKKHLAADCKISFHHQGGDSSGIVVDEKNPWLARAASALSEEWGVPTAMVGSGVSIPVVEFFRKYQKMESLLVGFARFDDGAHSPNEKYDVESFTRGAKSWVRLFDVIAKENVK